MVSRTKVMFITLVFAIPAFLLGPVIWPPAPDGFQPVGMQLVFLMGISAVEALALGLGIAFVLYGWPLVSALAGKKSKNMAVAMYLAISWMLISWWPHDNMHIHNGYDAWGLIRIEYLFHFTLIIASGVLAYGFFQHMRTFHKALAHIQ